MCFEVPALVPAGAPNAKSRSGGNDPDDDLNLMDPDGNDLKPGMLASKLALNLDEYICLRVVFIMSMLISYMTIIFPDDTSAELGTLNDALQELLDGIQVDLILLALTIEPKKRNKF